MLVHQTPQTPPLPPGSQQHTDLVHQDTPPACLMLLETAQKGRLAVSGPLARDACGGLEGQAMQAWAAWENPQPPSSCYLRCIQLLSRVHLEANALGFTRLLRLMGVGRNGKGGGLQWVRARWGRAQGGYVGFLDQGDLCLSYPAPLASPQEGSHDQWHCQCACHVLILAPFLMYIIVSYTYYQSSTRKQQACSLL